MSHELAGTLRPLAVVVTAADGLIAISTGTTTPVRDVADCLSSVRPGPRLLIVPLALPPPLDWLKDVAVVPRMQYPTVPLPGPRAVTDSGYALLAASGEGMVQPEPPASGV